MESALCHGPDRVGILNALSRLVEPQLCAGQLGLDVFLLLDDLEVAFLQAEFLFGELRRAIPALVDRKGDLESELDGEWVQFVEAGIGIAPRVSISDLMGILKGKTAIGIFKHFPNLRRKPYWGNHFWSRGCCVTTIGLDEERIRRYVRYQEETERLEEKEREEAGLF